MADCFLPVAVTGIGVVSPIGVGREQFWDALCAGRSGITPLPNADRVPRIAARLTEFSPRAFIHSALLRRADPLSQCIVAAARMALSDAGLDGRSPAPERIGIVIGSAIGNMSESVQYLQRVFTKGPGLASPMMFPNLVLNAPASYAAMEIGACGPNLTVSQGEASGEQAIALGCEVIRAGRADVVLAGGGDAFDAMVVSAYRAYRALSSQRGGPEWCGPYDVRRNGVVLGEGAAVLVLESVEHARRRGATVSAEIVGTLSCGVPSPLFDWPRHAPGAAVRLREFLDETLPPPGAVQLICGSANSSRRLDPCELEFLAKAFGETAGRVTVTSIKGAIGEFGAAGALTAAAVSLALRQQIVPPLCNMNEPESASFRFAGRRAAYQSIDYALTVSIARGGGVTAALFHRATE